MTNRCMIKNCARPAANRGLCMSCYSRAKKRVQSSQTTWDALVTLGLCEAAYNEFDAAYDQATKGGRDAETASRDNQRDVEGG